MGEPKTPRQDAPDDTEAALLIEQALSGEFDEEPDGLMEEGDIPPF